MSNKAIYYTTKSIKAIFNIFLVNKRQEKNFPFYL